jgi:hypothetical protein
MQAFRGSLYIGTGIQNGGFDWKNNIGPAAAEIVRLDTGDRASGNGRGIPSALPGFFIEIRLTRSDGDSLAPTGWSTMKDGAVFISLQPSACWLSPVEVFFVFSRQALRTKESLREKSWLFNRQPKPFRWRRRVIELGTRVELYQRPDAQR